MCKVQVLVPGLLLALVLVAGEVVRVGSGSGSGSGGSSSSSS